MEFIRFAGTINTHEEKKVAKATVNVILENCTGTFYIRSETPKKRCVESYLYYTRP